MDKPLVAVAETTSWPDPEFCHDTVGMEVDSSNSPKKFLMSCGHPQSHRYTEYIDEYIGSANI